MAKHYDKQFKLDAVQYYNAHRNLGLQGCVPNLGVTQQMISRWQKELHKTGNIECRGSGNYVSNGKDKKKVLKYIAELLEKQNWGLSDGFRKDSN